MNSGDAVDIPVSLRRHYPDQVWGYILRRLFTPLPTELISLSFEMKQNIESDASSLYLRMLLRKLRK